MRCEAPPAKLLRAWRNFPNRPFRQRHPFAHANGLTGMMKRATRPNMATSLPGSGIVSRRHLTFLDAAARDKSGAAMRIIPGNLSDPRVVELVRNPSGGLPGGNRAGQRARLDLSGLQSLASASGHLGGGIAPRHGSVVAARARPRRGQVDAHGAVTAAKGSGPGDAGPHRNERQAVRDVAPQFGDGLFGLFPACPRLLHQLRLFGLSALADYTLDPNSVFMSLALRGPQSADGPH